MSQAERGMNAHGHKACEIPPQIFSKYCLGRLEREEFSCQYIARFVFDGVQYRY